MTLRNYRLCQADGQSFQTITMLDKCIVLKTKEINQELFQIILENSPKFFNLPTSFFSVFRAVCQSC